MARDHRYEHIFASRLELAIGDEDLCVLIVERAVVGREQLRLNQISNGMVLHAPLDELRSISPATQSCLLVAFTIPPMGTLSYFFGVVQNCFDGLGGLTRRHRFCTAVRMEMALFVTKGLVAEIPAREQVPLLDISNMAALLSLDLSFTQSSHLFQLLMKFQSDNSIIMLFPIATT